MKKQTYISSLTCSEILKRAKYGKDLKNNREKVSLLKES